jgi:hypothetical protein
VSQLFDTPHALRSEIPQDVIPRRTTAHLDIVYKGTVAPQLRKIESEQGFHFTTIDSPLSDGPMKIIWPNDNNAVDYLSHLVAALRRKLESRRFVTSREKRFSVLKSVKHSTKHSIGSDFHRLILLW